MYRNSFVFLLVMCASVAYANNNEHADKFAEQLVSSQGIPKKQALEIVEQIDNMDGIVADIRDTLRGRVAGIYAEYTPKFTVVVRLKGNGSPPKKAYELANRHPIRFETGSKHTIEELVESYDKNFEQIKVLIPSVQGIGVDEKNGQIVISILNKDDQNNQAKNQIKKLLGRPVKFEVQEMEITDASLRGGRKILTNSYCTSGFTVKHTNGTVGTTTSAHCKGVRSYIDVSGTQISLSPVPNASYQNNRQDVAIYTNSSKTGFAEFFGANNGISKVTGRILRASTFVGMPACQQGATTGYSCGVVEKTNFKPAHSGACGVHTCDSTWVTVKPANPSSLACAGGDSGGPVFNGTKALGLLKAVVSNGTSKGQCHYFIYMATDYLPNGWSILYAK